MSSYLTLISTRLNILRINIRFLVEWENHKPATRLTLSISYGDVLSTSQICTFAYLKQAELTKTEELDNFFQVHVIDTSNSSEIPQSMNIKQVDIKRHVMNIN